MQSDRVVIRRTEDKYGYYTVESEGKISTFLCWGEMLEQVIALTHADIKHSRYHARTVEEEEAYEARRTAPPPAPRGCAKIIDGVRCGKDNACDRADCDQIPF